MSRAKKIIENSLTGALQGQLLSDDDCLRLDKIIALNEDKGFISDLKNIIYTLDNSVVDDILRDRSNELVSDEDMLVGQLTDTQTLGTAFMYTAKRCILGDSVGMGKTAQVMALHCLLSKKYSAEGKSFRSLIFTEKAIVDQLQREAVRFTGEYFGGLPSTPQLDGFLLDHLDGLPNLVVGHSLGKSAKFQEVLLAEEESTGSYPYNLVVIDESGSVLGNNKSDIYNALRAIADKAEYVVLLNATSFESALGKFYNQLDFVDKTFLPTRGIFQSRYCILKRRGNYSVPTGEYKNQGEFRGKVRYRYFARTRRELGSRFEGCSSSLLLLDRSEAQEKFIDIASYPQMVYDNPSYFDGELRFHQQNPKVGALYNLIQGTAKGVEGDWGNARTVLVYCHYKEVMEGLANILQAKGIAVKTLNGDTDRATRLEVIDSFQSGKFRVLITNVMKGLNFGSTNHIIAYSVPGNVNQMVQFEGRTTREFDIVGKHLAVLCTKGKEHKRLKEVLRQRAKDSSTFAGSDNSLILSLLFKLES